MVSQLFQLPGKSLNKSWAWHIDGATNKNLYDFYNVLTFKWHVSKFEPNRIISIQISYLNEPTVWPNEYSVCQ